MSQNEKGAAGAAPEGNGTREAQSLGSNGAEAQVGTAAAGFLQLLRAAGPWVLSAIAPDGPIETATVRHCEQGWLLRRDEFFEFEINKSSIGIKLFQSIAQVQKCRF